MDLIAVLVGGVVLGVILTLGILRSRKSPAPHLVEEVPEVDEPGDVYEVAFGAAEAPEAAVTRRGGAVIFGLPPRAQEPQEKDEEIVEATMQEDKVLVEGHPCVHLSGETPPNYKPSECSGICQAPGQNGRPCFWASNAASKCPYFRPKVLPRRVKLKRVG